MAKFLSLDGLKYLWEIMRGTFTPYDMFKFNDSKTVTTGAGLSGWTYSFTLDQNYDGSVFLFHGTCSSTTDSGQTMTLTAIPGGSGNYTYGCKTGLFLKKPPSKVIGYVSAGVYKSSTGSGVSNAWTSALVRTFSELDLAVGTDGQIYINPSNSNSSSWTASLAYKIIYFPYPIFNL